MVVFKLIRPLINLIPEPFRNKYFMILAIYILILVFFDKNDLITQIRLQRTLNRLEDDRKFYEQKIEEAKASRQSFDENKERFARENYLMKRPDEDVFIIVEEE
jgi:cell division protein DivIC